MKKLLAMMAAALCVGMFAGCDWESADEDTEAWNSDYNWVNFSGSYRPLNAGAMLVVDFNSTPGTAATTNVARNELVGSTTGDGTFYSGYVDNYPIGAGTFTLEVHGFVFIDDGLGALAASGQRLGGVNYRTGFWWVDLQVNVPDGEAITATYAYSVDGTDGVTYQGNTGNPIYLLTAIQQGNLLTLIDNNGNQFTGKMGSARTLSGDALVNTTEGVIAAQFEVQGTAYGQFVRIVGTLEGTLTTGSANVLLDRLIEATWIESSGRTGDIVGGAGPTLATP